MDVRSKYVRRNAWERHIETHHCMIRIYSKTENLGVENATFKTIKLAYYGLQAS